MRVGITQRVVQGEGGDLRDALEQSYIQYYTSFGLTLIPIPNSLPNIQAYLQELSIAGIILSGGNDVNPSLYGGTHSVRSTHSPQRDSTEQELLRIATSHRMPVLGVCRGLQFMNINFGGKIQPLKEHVSCSHSIHVEGHQRIGLNAGATEVNSFHSFGIREEDIAPPLSVFARANDATIEGLYHPNLPIAGIMWHPERPSADPEFNSNLLRAFANKTGFWVKRPV